MGMAIKEATKRASKAWRFGSVPGGTRQNQRALGNASTCQEAESPSLISYALELIPSTIIFWAHAALRPAIYVVMASDVMDNGHGCSVVTDTGELFHMSSFAKGISSWISLCTVEEYKRGSMSASSTVTCTSPMQLRQ